MKTPSIKLLNLGATLAISALAAAHLISIVAALGTLVFLVLISFTAFDINLTYEELAQTLDELWD